MHSRPRFWLPRFGATRTLQASAAATALLCGSLAPLERQALRAEPMSAAATFAEGQHVEFKSELPQGLIAAPAMDEIATAHLVPTSAVPGVSQVDTELVQSALTEYRRGRLAEGDAIAGQVSDEGARLALEWAAIRLGRQSLGFARLARFSERNPDFPMADWVRRRAEDALFVEKRPPATILAFFKDRPPEMAGGAIALARVHLQNGKDAEAEALARQAWRARRTNQATRSAILNEFPQAISTADKQFLAEKLIYEGDTAEGSRIAVLAGPKAVALAQILTASINETGGALALISKLEPAQQGEAAAIFARAQHFRRANQPLSAAQAMLMAPADPAKIVNGDEWWVERRLISRKLLDVNEPDLAYKVAVGHLAQSSANRVDAEVHAGWIALRFLNRPDVAAQHFASARAMAVAPASLARASYWRGRAAEAMGLAESIDFYRDSGTYGHTFYGQLASARQPALATSGQSIIPDAGALEAVTRLPALRAVRVLLEIGARDLAQPLIADAAMKARNRVEVIAIGDLSTRFGLPRLTLLAGKSAMQRGIPALDYAFPVFGIPPYQQGQDMAEPPMVYSIARQESEFDPKVVSHAGARGLMQLMPATAQRTASKAKLPYDVNLLTADPALNVRIGATHLGELLAEYNGSYILTFAAYNAGGGRVKEWIKAYGDPRNPDVDPIDWIERIPITETRHYVQKVLENLQVYRQRLDRVTEPGISADLLRGLRRPKSDVALQVP